MRSSRTKWEIARKSLISMKIEDAVAGISWMSGAQLATLCTFRTNSLRIAETGWDPSRVHSIDPARKKALRSLTLAPE
jgi:hypothetical protein